MTRDPNFVTATHVVCGRNDRCNCGSGAKFKKCCGEPAKRAAAAQAKIRAIEAALESRRLARGPDALRAALRALSVLTAVS